MERPSQPQAEAPSGPRPPGPPKGAQGWAAGKLPIVPGPRPPVGTDDRRRPGGWNEFRRAYPGVIGTLWVALVALLVTDAMLARKRDDYTAEITRLRSGMSIVERRSADLELANNEKQLRVMVELARRQAQGDKELHLSVAVDSGVMYLEREGALLREMPVRVGPERRVGVGHDTVRMVAPRGSRTVEKILTADSAWDVPRWVYADRHLTADSNRAIKGALGEAAIVLNGGAVIYGDPRVGPLADSTYVLPGSIRARLADLRAIVPNLRPGTNVYLY
jgi:hypothetical protein